MNGVIMLREVAEKVIVIRGENVLIDRDIAELYGVETREVNLAVRNNPDKFPSSYIITLDSEEKNELVKNIDRFNTMKHSTVAPSAFTES